jgi:hypothetical protein
MRAFRGLVLVVLFAAAVGAAWWFIGHRSSSVGDAVAVYYTKEDGATLAAWRVSLGPARDRTSVAFYAATQCVAGPPPATTAVRFPAGTRVLHVDVSGASATVDLSFPSGIAPEGSFAEPAEFKALVWTLTQPALAITSVNVRIDGARVATLPGGHLELDDAFTRSSFQ